MKTTIHPIELLLDNLADALVRDGFQVLPWALPAQLVSDLWHELQVLPDHELKVAGIGRQDDFQLNRQIRRDKIHWFDGVSAPQQGFLDWMEVVRMGLNRRLFLGLFDYECHYASYAPGAFYKKHFDAFKNQPVLAAPHPAQPNRVLSTVLYLNPDWQADAGGELRLYDELDDEKLLQCVTPEYGKMIIFLSDKFPHEVMAAKRERQSIAGWFRNQGAL